MRVFSVGELWGPLSCEMDGCPEKDAYNILLTDQENAMLPEESGPTAIAYIFSARLGYVLCDKHLEQQLNNNRGVE